jgi:CDP-diacylglycerol--serine O-phosphatidyltransferase
VPFISILLLVFVFIIIFLDPPRVLFLTFLAYVLSGPALFIWRFYQKKRRARKFAKPAD